MRAILHVVNFGLGSNGRVLASFFCPCEMHWESVWYLCSQRLSEEGQSLAREAVSGMVGR